MAKNTLTFELGGRVAIADFANGVVAFQRLIAVLTPRNAGVTWVVDDLQPGSALVTLRGESENPAAVADVVEKYEAVGAGLSEHNDLHKFDKRVRDAAYVIRDLTGATEYVRFETSEGDYTIYANGHTPNRTAPTVAIGAITGRVQTLSNRSGLRFNLYDALFDKAVACYLAPGQEEQMRAAWGQRARVSGRVSREASTGRPIAIRQIMNVEILGDVKPGSYREARGAVPWQPGHPSPEEVIRRLRDA